jgi:two-component system LytT family response regulator
MKPHTALIVDDEPIARREIARLLHDCPDIEIVGEAASVDEAVEALGRVSPDIVFLDVQMPGASGFDLFDSVAVNAHVIFVTAYDQFALRAFEVNALDYLLKPVRPERLRESIDRHLRRLPAGSPATARFSLADSILLMIDRVPRFVRVGSIECIMAEGDYTRVIAVGGPIGMVLKSMKAWEDLLPQKHFCRIGRSTIINCEHALRFDPAYNGGYEVYMKHLGAPLVMSRRSARQFKARFRV